MSAGTAAGHPEEPEEPEEYVHSQLLTAVCNQHGELLEGTPTPVPGPAAGEWRLSLAACRCPQDRKGGCARWWWMRPRH